MARLLQIFGFLSVLLRGASLTFQSLTVGGVVFLCVILRKSSESSAEIKASCLSWLRRFAMVLAAMQISYLVANSLILMESAQISLAQVSGANFVLAGALGIAASRQHASARVGHRHDGILGKRDIRKQRLQPFEVHADRQHGDDSLGRVPHRIREHDDRLPADDTGLKLRDDRFSGRHNVLHIRHSDGFADVGAARAQ